MCKICEWRWEYLWALQNIAPVIFCQHRTSTLVTVKGEGGRCKKIWEAPPEMAVPRKLHFRGFETLFRRPRIVGAWHHRHLVRIGSTAYVCAVSECTPNLGMWGLSMVAQGHHWPSSAVLFSRPLLLKVKGGGGFCLQSLCATTTLCYVIYYIYIIAHKIFWFGCGLWSTIL